MKSSFSKWPGAWERHLVRRFECPQYFEGATRPTSTEIAVAQLKDQQELSQFHSALETLIARCMDLTDETSAESVVVVKKELDTCHDTAFGLATDLTDQKNAIASLNEIITGVMQKALAKSDEPNRLRLMQIEAARMEQLHRLEYPIVCDLLRAVSPIPRGEVTGALLAESDTAYKAVLEIFDNDRKTYLAQRIDIIMADLDSHSHKIQVLRKLELLHKHLPESPPQTNTSSAETIEDSQATV